MPKNCMPPTTAQERTGYSTFTAAPLVQWGKSMNLIVAALPFFIGCSALAQDLDATLQVKAGIEAERIQLEQVIVPALTMGSHSISGARAAISIPEGPTPIPMAATLGAVAAPNSRKSEFRGLVSDRINRVLIATEFGARGLDAFSTHSMLNNPCRCYRESSHFFGLNIGPVFESATGAFSYSFAVATACSLISAKLWNRSKEHPRHARLLRRLSRALLIGDSTMEITADFRNLDISRSSGLID